MSEPKRRPGPHKIVDKKTFTVCCSGKMYSDLKSIADAIGLDLSSLVRMILSENLPPYLARLHRLSTTPPS